MQLGQSFRLIASLLPVILISSATTQQSPAQSPVQGTVIATVTDHSHHLITGLAAEDFTLYVNDQKQPINSVIADVPACIGLLIDRSGSMRGRNVAIASGMAEFVRASNTDDSFFVVTFNDDPFLEHDFTHDPAVVEQAIVSQEPRGGTALYDAIVASTDHLAKNKACKKRALLIVGDGGDNSSRENLDKALAALRNGENPLVYIIWLPHPNNGTPHSAQSALSALAAPSGGATYFVKNTEEVRERALKIAEEIKSQYSISYEAPANSGSSNMKIEAHAAGQKDLTVRVNVAGQVKAAPRQ